jgi:trigger factor
LTLSVRLTIFARSLPHAHSLNAWAQPVHFELRERSTVNLTVEDLGSCKKLLRFEIEEQAVDAAFAEVEKDFKRHAALPGFRPGKAPADMVLKKFEKEILDEAKRKIISENYKAGLKEKKIEVVNLVDVEEVQFVRGKAAQFVATVETEPIFEIPEYRGLPAKREITSVTDDDVERAIQALREQRATFQKMDREVREGDIAVVNYHGTCDGQPITDLAPAARGLTEQKNFWVEVRKDSFIPGFSEQLTGAKAGDKRTVNVEFPPQFAVSQIAGKKGVYEVEIVEVKEKLLPVVDDALAQSWEAENVEKLRVGVRSDLQNELNLKQKQSIRNQVINALMEKIQFELPESFVQDETRAAVYDIVSDNQQRGVTKETIEQQKDQIYAVATRSAKERVKASFLLQKIAEKEGIRVVPEAVNARIAAMARANNVPTQQFFKDVEKSGRLQQIVQQLLHERVIDFLQEHAKIEDVAPAAAPAA